jgi:hypothetical protein
MHNDRRSFRSGDQPHIMIEAIVWVVVLGGIVALMAWGGRPRRRSRVGSAAVGTVYGMLNEEKRNAVEIIVEGRAEARDPEDKDGNLPDLEHPDVGRSGASND